MTTQTMIRLVPLMLSLIAIAASMGSVYWARKARQSNKGLAGKLAKVTAERDALDIVIRENGAHAELTWRDEQTLEVVVSPLAPGGRTTRDRREVAH